MPSYTIQARNFNLDVGGVAGFFGGEEAVSAMETVHLHRGRRWGGWFNSPGSYSVGKHFGILSNSRIWEGLFPGPRTDPTTYMGLDGKLGPMYLGSQSGTSLGDTGHLAYLLMQICKERPAVTVEGRQTRPNRITIVETQDIKFDDSPQPSLTIPPCDGYSKYLAFFPIAISIVTCTMSALGDDWYCFSLILLGMCMNGILCFVLGSADIVLQSVKSSKTAPPGDGILMDGNNIVVLLGKEKNIAAITRGKFALDYKPWVCMPIKHVKRKRRSVAKPREGNNEVHRWLVHQGDSESVTSVHIDEDDEINKEYSAIGISSFFLVIQFLTQLLLIPQGKLFGQVMFLISFATSWAYNLFLASMDKESLQEDLLVQALGLSDDCMETYKLGTRTSAAVFACLILQPDCDSGEWGKMGYKPLEILRQFIPNDTPVWAVWKDQILTQMKSRSQTLELLEVEACDGRIVEFNTDERGLLGDLLSDARSAYKQYLVLEVRRRTVSTASTVQT